MMDNIQYFIADRQYQDALANQNATLRPYHQFPKPTKEEFDRYVAETSLELVDILDSPIGVFEFRRFAQKHKNFPVVIDFLVQYERVQALETPDLNSARDLMLIAMELPSLYDENVAELKTAFRAAFGPIELPEVREDKFLNDRIQSLELEDEEENHYASVPVDSQGNEAFPDPKTVVENSVFPSFGGPTEMKPGSLFSPFGRASISFGGFKGIKTKAKPEGRRSSINTEFLDQETLGQLRNDQQTGEENDVGDFYDRQQAMRMKELEMKRELKAQCLQVFSELAATLDTKALNLLQFFKQGCPEYTEMINMMWYSEQKMSVSDFILFRDLGRGAFGVVSSAKTKTTGTLTAIKCMNKKLVKGKKAKRLVSVEKAILEVLGDNPSHFTIWLKYSFQDADYFYMAIPLCTGGDLAFHLKRKTCFEEGRAMFTFAEILEGLDHLHSLQIVYRDLKPENIIFDAEGHARISDMGLAIQTDGKKIRGKAGTPGYWAPEVITRQPYSYSADYWSLGCVLYEMLVGLCPFSSTNTRMDREKATLQWKIRFPDKVGKRDKPELLKPFPENAIPVILGLLDRRRGKRFDAVDVRESAWFEGFDWNALRSKQIPVPWKPKKGQIYAADALELDYASNDANYRKQKLGPEDEIENFEYTSKYSHQMDIVQVLETRDAGKLEYDRRSETSWCCFM